MKANKQPIDFKGYAAGFGKWAQKTLKEVGPSLLLTAAVAIPVGAVYHFNKTAFNNGYDAAITGKDIGAACGKPLYGSVPVQPGSFAGMVCLSGAMAGTVGAFFDKLGLN